MKKAVSSGKRKYISGIVRGRLGGRPVSAAPARGWERNQQDRRKSPFQEAPRHRDQVEMGALSRLLCCDIESSARLHPTSIVICALLKHCARRKGLSSSTRIEPHSR